MRTQLGLFALVLLPLANCNCDEVTTQLAPKIEIGDPYDKTFSVCEKDFVRDCSFNFGNVPLGQGKFFSFMIKNPSPVNLQVYSLKVEGSGADQFQFEGDVPTEVKATEGEVGRMVTLKFAPRTATPFSAKLVIKSDAENLNPDEDVEIELLATGDDSAVPDIEVSPERCEFGDVGVGATAFCDLSITNAGQRELQISDYAIVSDDASQVFGARSPIIIPTFIQAGTAMTVRLSAQPTALGAVTGMFTIMSNDPDEGTLEVPLSVTGAETPTAVGRVKSINGLPNNSPTPQIEPLDNVVLSGDQSVAGRPGGTIVEYQWTLISQPDESSVELTNGNRGTNPDTGFVFQSAAGNVQALDVVGTYVIGLVVWDDTGAQSSNTAELTLNAVPTEGLHVQLTWDTPTNDIDLHLARGQTPDWCSATNDCYYSNCTGGFLSPNWDSQSGGGDPGDPTLDIDDLSGFGPENTNIDVPTDGVYTVGIDYFGGTVPSFVTVKIFLGGALAWESGNTISNAQKFWTAARVDVANGQMNVTPIEQFGDGCGAFGF